MKTKYLTPILLSIMCISMIFTSCTKGKAEKNAQVAVPERIVSLGSSATEILFALGAGDQIAARTDFCNYPPEAASLPSVGGFDGKTTSLETIISYEPDFVYMFKGMHDYLIEPLENAGIKYYLSDATSVQAVLDEITAIGEITGHTNEASALVRDIKTAIPAPSEVQKTVYWEIWNAPYMSIGGPSFINDVIATAGGKNIFADVENAYPNVSEESIIARNPDVIFIPSDSPVTVEDVKGRPGWQDISAVKNDAVYKINADVTSRPGPRIREAFILIKDFLNK